MHEMFKVSSGLAACLSTVAIGLCLIGVPMVYMEIQATRQQFDADMIEFRVGWLVYYQFSSRNFFAFFFVNF